MHARAASPPPTPTGRRSARLALNTESTTSSRSRAPRAVAELAAVAVAVGATMSGRGQERRVQRLERARERSACARGRGAAGRARAIPRAPRRPSIGPPRRITAERSSIYARIGAEAARRVDVQRGRLLRARDGDGTPRRRELRRAARPGVRGTARPPRPCAAAAEQPVERRQPNIQQHVVRQVRAVRLERRPRRAHELERERARQRLASISARATRGRR